jgi:hypothetical protein
MPQLSLNNKKLFLQLILSINQWGVSIATGVIFGWNFGENLWSLLLFLIGICYQLSLGILVNTKVIAALDSIKKEKAELELEQKKILDIHSQLDELRDRLIFEQDNKYWEILQQLPVQKPFSSYLGTN